MPTNPTTPQPSPIHCEIWLIRHGETDWNAAHRMQGRTDIALNATGHMQAQALKLMLEKTHEERNFSAAYATPLQRSKQTAAPIAAATELTLGTVVDLQERAFGVIEGQPYATVRDGIGATPELTEVARAMHARELDYLPPVGESGQTETLRQFYERTVQAAQTLASLHAGQRIFVVTHGGVLDCLWRWANGVAIEAPRTWSIVNASVNVLSINGAGGEVSVMAWGVQAGSTSRLALDEVRL